MRITGVTGMILAGGLSTRIGRDKGALEIGGRVQSLRVVDRMLALFPEVVYATNDHGFVSPADNVVVVYDEVPHLGPLGGIAAGLKAAAFDRAFTVAYDMPFVLPELAKFLVDFSPEADVTVPVVAGRYEPLHAIYNRRCLAVIEEHLAAGKRKLTGFYDEMSVAPVEEEDLRIYDPDLLSFFNINTWEDVERAESLFRDRD